MNFALVMAIIVVAAFPAHADQTARGYDLADLSFLTDSVTQEILTDEHIKQSDLTKRISRCSFIKPAEVLACVKEIETPDWVELGWIDPITDESKYFALYELPSSAHLVIGCIGTEDSVALTTSTAILDDVVDVIVRFDKEVPIESTWSKGGDG